MSKTSKEKNPPTTKNKTSKQKNDISFNSFQKKLYNINKDLTIILDLDNTLIYALFSPSKSEKVDFSFIIQNSKLRSKVGIIKRPNVDLFLKSLSSIFTVYLFTTSDKEYAAQILKHIDPSEEYFTKIFTREFCTQDGTKKYIKDYSICKTNMARTLIVDDIPENFKNFPKNGIYVKPFVGDVNDNELIGVFEEIVRLSYFEDVRDGHPE